jgi:hypothetical protein
MSASAFTVGCMDLAQPGMEPLQFPDLVLPGPAPPGTRPVEITVSAPGREFPLMNVVTTEDHVLRDFAIAYRHAVEVPGWEIRIGPFAG